MKDYKGIWGSLYEKSKFPIDKNCKIYKDVKNGGIGDFHYAQMHDRLEKVGVDGKLGEDGKELGYILRALWWSYEEGLRVHDTKMHCGICEKDWNDLSEREKEERKRKKTNFGEFKCENGEVYIDLVYDTFWKDWEKSYQNTFHEFFHNIDHLVCKENSESSSKKYKTSKVENFGKTIMNDVMKLGKEDLNKIHAMPNQDKAYLYDIIGGVLIHSKYGCDNCSNKKCNKDIFLCKNKDNYKILYGHGPNYWLGSSLLSYLKKHETNVIRTFNELAKIAEITGEFTDSYEPAINTFLEDRSNKESENNYIIACANIVAKVAIKIRNKNIDIFYTDGKFLYNRITEEYSAIVEGFCKDFYDLLAPETFANMASVAIVNPKTFEAMKKYLKESYKMFIEILKKMTLGI